MIRSVPMAEDSIGAFGSWPEGSMQALVMASRGVLGIQEVPVPDVADGYVLVKVSFVGICGTDLHLLSGESAYLEQGLTRYPVRFGHEWAGEVVAVGSGVPSRLVGRTVVGQPFISCGQCLICRRGHYNLCPTRQEMGVRGDVPGAASEFLRAPASNVAVVPEGVPAEEALLAEPTVTILNAAQLTCLQPGESVAVVGTGTMGLLAVQVAASMGCHVDAIGVDEGGLGAAARMGAAKVARPPEALGAAYDVVVEATGSRQVGELIGRIAGVGARVAIVGIPSGPVQGLEFATVVAKGLVLKGVLGGVHLLANALELMSNGRIMPGALIDEIIPVGSASEAFARASQPGRERPKVILDLRGFGAPNGLAGSN